MDKDIYRHIKEHIKNKNVGTKARKKPFIAIALVLFVFTTAVVYSFSIENKPQSITCR